MAARKKKAAPAKNYRPASPFKGLSERQKAPKAVGDIRRGAKSGTLSVRGGTVRVERVAYPVRRMTQQIEGLAKLPKSKRERFLVNRGNGKNYRVTSRTSAAGVTSRVGSGSRSTDG
jgi:hypothetical protein